MELAKFSTDADRLARQTANASEERIVITYTNRAALAWNQLIRQHRWGMADLDLQAGDILMNTRRDPRTGYENGDQLLVLSVGDAPLTVSALGRHVVLQRVTAKRLGDSEETSVLLMINALQSEERTVDKRDFQVLWVDFRERNRDLKQGTKEFWEAAYRDVTLNPLVAKYGYAMTCHRAQGGQWDGVAVDFNSLAIAPDSAEAFRWTYTAVTRAEVELVLVDLPYRSPFSRLMPSPEPLAEQSDQRGVSSEEMRNRAEQAIKVWANSSRISIEQLRKSDYHTRFVAVAPGTSTVFDAFFKGDGRITNVLLVSSIGEPPIQPPPLYVIERVVFADMPRPGDARVEEALRLTEEALATGDLQVQYRGQRDWRLELEVADGDDRGVLVVFVRKTGVLASPTWSRPPSADLKQRVAAILRRLADG